jgi:hypothetical protein
MGLIFYWMLAGLALFGVQCGIVSCHKNIAFYSATATSFEQWEILDG